MRTFNQFFLTLVRALALLSSEVTRLTLTCRSNFCIILSRTPSRCFTSISSASLVRILLSFIIIDSTHANSIAGPILTSMFLSSHFNTKLTPYINAFNSATFMQLASVFFLNQAASSALTTPASNITLIVKLLALHQTMPSSTFSTWYFPLAGSSLFASLMISFILSVLSLSWSSHLIFSTCHFT